MMLPQDLCAEIGRGVSCIMVHAAMEKEVASNSGAEIRTNAARQVSSFIATSFGMSSKDLPKFLQSKFEDFGKKPWLARFQGLVKY